MVLDPGHIPSMCFVWYPKHEKGWFSNHQISICKFSVSKETLGRKWFDASKRSPSCLPCKSSCLLLREWILHYALFTKLLFFRSYEFYFVIIVVSDYFDLLFHSYIFVLDLCLISLWCECCPWAMKAAREKRTI